MNLLKRFFPIAGMAACLIGGIAVGTVYKQWSTTVRASTTPATVVISCANGKPAITNSSGTYQATSSNSTVVLPSLKSATNPGDDCATAIQGIRNQGFRLRDGTVETISNYTTWTFTRGVE